MLAIYADFFNIATRTELRNIQGGPTHDDMQPEHLRRRRAELRKRKRLEGVFTP